MKKRKVGKEGPMYTHNDFRASVSVRVRTADINVKRTSVLDLISVGTGPKAHSGGPEAHHYSAELCRILQNLGVVKKIKVVLEGNLN